MSVIQSIVSAALSVPVLALAPAGADQRAVTEPTGERIVYVSGSNRLNAVNVASGRRVTRTIASVPACGPELIVDAGRVVFAGITRKRTTVLSLPLSLTGPPKRLGKAHMFVPSGTPGRVWLAGVDCDVRRLIGARELTVRGRTTAASPRRLPRGWLAGAVSSGLLVQRGRRPRLWSPESGRLGPRLPLDGVHDTHRDRAVGFALGSRARRLAVVNAGSGTLRTVLPPRGYTFWDAAELSPDGSLVGASVTRRGRVGWALALARASGGRAWLVPGSRTTGRTAPVASWSAASGRLLFRVPDGAVKGYMPGEARAASTPVTLPDQRPWAAG